MTLSGQVHYCSAGETFDIVAHKEYGDEKFACELLNANPSLSHIPIFMGGEVLELPVVEVVNVQDGLRGFTDNYMPAKAPWKE